MDEIARRLVELYMDLTESMLIHLQFSENKIKIIIVSDWFQGLTLEERLDYLAEGIQVSCPDLLQNYTFHFVAQTTVEAMQPQTARLVS